MTPHATGGRIGSEPVDILSALEPLARHRRHVRPVTLPLLANDETRSVGLAIANCAHRIAVDIPLLDGEVGEAKLRHAYLCNRRLCPFCEWRRSRVWRARLLRGLEAYRADHPTHKAVFLTLTVANCELGRLGQTITDMNHAWNRLCKWSAFPSTAWFRRTEITIQQEAHRQPMAHPHFHVLMMVPASYFGTGYIKHSEWRAQWQVAARLDYAPVVDIRRARVKGRSSATAGADERAAVIEAAKYASKATDLVALGDNLPLFHHEIRAKRFYSVSRELGQYVNTTDPKKSDLLDVQDPMIDAEHEWLSAVAEWAESEGCYRFLT